MGKLQGKVAVITGGISGIGAATARLFAKEGAKLLLVDISEEKGQAFVAELKSEGVEDVIFLAADVTDEQRASEVFSKAVETYGQVDILMNNAGVGWTGPTVDYPLKDYYKIIDVDLNAVFIYAQKAIQLMLKQESKGVIINTASMYGMVGAAQSAAYNAAKGGVINLTRSLGLEFAKDGIRVNAICPGYIDTPIIPVEMKEYLAQTTPMGRMGQPEEIATGALFLASDDASFMTANTLVIDGGYTAG